MFLRRHARHKDGKDHTYWSLVETVRTPDGPRQRTLCYLGELNGSAQARWVKTIEVFNAGGGEPATSSLGGPKPSDSGQRNLLKPALENQSFALSEMARVFGQGNPQL